MTHFYVIRHGETEWNIQRRFQGQCNSPLTEAGIAQAVAAQPQAAALAPDVVYSSDSQRAVETAKLLLPTWEPVQNPLLREIALGDLEGVCIDDPGDLKSVADQWYEHPDVYLPAGNGESVPQLMERAQAFLNHVATQHRGQQVVAISHGATIRALWMVVTGALPSTFWQAPRVHNLDTLHFVYEDGQWQYLPQEEVQP